MIDYEDLILQRQELQEIYEDDPDIIDIRSVCDTCYLYNRGISCGVEAGICKQEVFIDGDLSK